MPKVVVHTDQAPKSLAGYSQAITTIQEQTAQCLRNIEAILRAAGSSLDKAVQATFIHGEEADFPGMNEGMRVSIALVAEA